MLSAHEVLTGGQVGWQGEGEVGDTAVDEANSASWLASSPRHILIGCIGGVGWFLLATGFEVSARLLWDCPRERKPAVNARALALARQRVVA